MEELFQELAKQLIKDTKSRITTAYFSDSKIKALKELKAELQALKEAYAVVYNPESTVTVDVAFDTMVNPLLKLG